MNKHMMDYAEKLIEQQREIIERRESEGIYAAVRDASRSRMVRDWIRRGAPAIAGGDIAAASQPVHPLAPPTLSGTSITVDLMLQQPTRITRMIMDLSLQRFVADRVFSSGGGVTGGAVVYDEAVRNELYLDRDVERVEPGAEFPTVTAERFVPKIAPVEKWGGKVWIPDEARDRNQTVTFTNKIRQLTNTIIRKINQIAVQTLMDSITSSGQTGVGNDWSAVVTGGSSQSNATLWPLADFIHVNQDAFEDELGVEYNLVLLNPADYAQLAIVYGADNLPALLNALGYSLYVSNRVTVGQPIFVAEGQVGEMRVEKPLSSETWRQPERQRTWTQADVRPVMFVNNPYAVRRVTGV